MFKYAQLFIDYLSGMNAKFEVQVGVDENGNEALARVQIPYSGTKITASFFGDEKGSNFSASMAIGAIVPEFITLVSEDVIALCNEFNNNNQWVKFCVRDSSSVPGLNGALICLEESTVLVEKTAAQDAYSIVSNLIKAFSESAESFKKILNRSPEEKEKEKADNKPLTKFYIGITQVSREDICKIESLLKQNEKIEAINLVRNLSGLGLKEAKAFIDNYSSYNLNAPQRISTNENPKNIVEEKPKETPKRTDKKTNNNFNMWFPVILAAVGIFGGVVLSIQTQLLGYVFLGFIMSCCGLGIMLKQKKKRKAELFELKDSRERLSALNQQKKSEKLPVALTWVLFVLGVMVYVVFCSVLG